MLLIRALGKTVIMLSLAALYFVMYFISYYILHYIVLFDSWLFRKGVLVNKRINKRTQKEANEIIEMMKQRNIK